jgi:ParB family transcriptional regulator, chromosome partitioning protein
MMSESAGDSRREGAVEPRREEAKKSRLGRGLSALLGEYLPEDGEGTPLGIRSVPVGRITSNPFQPRREFTAEQLAELEASIRSNGLLQPLVVRPTQAGTGGVPGWELVAGERRWRAVRRLGWSEVPVVVRDVDDRTMLVLAIVENVQREELTPLEEALAYRQLVDEFGLTQREVAESVGRERSTVANLMRLLSLPASVQRLVNDGALSMGHARALLGAGDERRIADLARETVAKGLTVRTLEERVRDGREAPTGRKTKQRAGSDDVQDPHLRRLEGELQRTLGTAARIRVTRGQSGRIEIPFYNADDFDRIIELLLESDETRL